MIWLRDNWRKGFRHRKFSGGLHGPPDHAYTRCEIPKKAGNTGKYKTERIKGTWEYRGYRREDIK
jgi:hypothetical protein